MSAWKVCVDESYDDRWFVVAGAIATKSTWRTFNGAWRRALGANTPRPISYFSQKETGRTEHADCPFYGWPREEIEEKAAALGEVMQTLDGRLATYVNRADFDRTVRMSQFDERYQDEYYLGFFQAIRLAAHHMNSLPAPQRAPVFVFDRLDKKMRSRAREVWEHLKENTTPKEKELYGITRWRRGEPLFMSDREDGGKDHVDIGLQAADVYAWHFRNGLRRRSQGEPWTPPGFMDAQAITHPPVSRRSLKMWASAMKEMLFEKGNPRDPRTPWEWQSGGRPN